MPHDEATFSLILSRIMDGKSLKEVCDAEDMPARKTVYEWMAKNEELSNRYARACEIRADHLFDELIQIADTPKPGLKIKTDADGKVETTEGDMIEHRRLQIDARKWALAKMQPKKYGDKLDLNHAGQFNVVISGDDADL